MPEISSNYWENLFEVIVGFAILALLIERGLYQIFDSRLWLKFESTLNKQVGGEYMDLKPWISIAVSITIVLQCNLDMVQTIFGRDESSPVSMVLTGLFVSGGSTGVYKFFKRVREMKDAVAGQKLAQAKSASAEPK
ncbi:MAG: hypothetical protein Q8P51_08925 [Ignavibacteria bacterium]|nr:hypothetical protein [Ignavibacteria bacterium]